MQKKGFVPKYMSGALLQSVRGSDYIYDQILVRKFISGYQISRKLFRVLISFLAHFELLKKVIEEPF